MGNLEIEIIEKIVDNLKMVLGNSLGFLVGFLWDAHPQTCILQVELCGVSQRRACGFCVEEGSGNGQRRGKVLLLKQTCEWKGGK